MSNKSKSGSHRRCDTSRYHKRQKQERENRQIKTERRVKREEAFRKRIQPRKDAPSRCPLCNQPITQEDLRGNIRTVKVGPKIVRVHGTCPGEQDD